MCGADWSESRAEYSAACCELRKGGGEEGGGVCVYVRERMSEWCMKVHVLMRHEKEGRKK